MPFHKFEAGIAGFLKCVGSRRVEEFPFFSIELLGCKWRTLFEVSMLMAGTCPPNAHCQQHGCLDFWIFLEVIK